MPIKTMIKYHLTPVIIVIIKKTPENNMMARMWKIETNALLVGM